MRVEMFCGMLVFSEVALLLHSVFIAKEDNSLVNSVWATISLAWFLWIATQVENSRLVKCGTQAYRFRLASRAINRPEFAVRMAFHVLINWSAIVVALLVAYVLRSSALAEIVAWACIVATVAVWGLFNVLHRKVNRLRNLAFTTVIATVLILIAINLLVPS
jgi:hypothetical protein